MSFRDNDIKAEKEGIQNLVSKLNNNKKIDNDKSLTQKSGVGIFNKPCRLGALKS